MNAPEGVVFADDALVVFDKPAGLPSVPGRPIELHDCAASRMQAWFGDTLVVHRLDMATSGLLLLARNLGAQRRLSQAFAQRQVRKLYLAWVHGHLLPDSGQIELPLGAEWALRPRQKVDLLAGKAAITAWRVLQRDPARQRTLVELQPHTGRTHQLRVHLLAIGHGIVGDTLYGNGLAEAPRLLLHACQLELSHPNSGAAMFFKSAPPF